MKQPVKAEVAVVDGEKNEGGNKSEIKKKYKKPKKLKPKHIIIAVIIVLILGVGGFLLYNLFFGEDEAVILTDTTTYGALNATIEGTGTTMPADSVTYSLADSTEILEVDVAMGDEVQAGQLLYRQDSSAVDSEIEEYEASLTEYQSTIDSCNDSIDEYQSNIDDAPSTIADYQDSIADYENTIADYQEQISDINDDIAALTTSAQNAGRLINVAVEKGDTVQSGAVMATLVVDTKMKLTQYFSYAYEDNIYIGQTATVSVPDLMLNLTGTVTNIQTIERVTAEGTKCFAVTITMNNPGALTAGMSVGGYLINTDGSYIYPSIEGTLDYYSSISITAKGSGELITCNAVNYQTVSVGAILFQISSKDYEDQIKTINKQIKTVQGQIDDLEDQITAVPDEIESWQKKIVSMQDKITQTESQILSTQEKITEAQESYANYDVYSEISGVVIACRISVGDTGTKGDTAVMIYNLDSMSITVNIDDLDIDYIKTGMTVALTKSGAETDTPYTGTVTEVSLEATTTSGVSTFPVTITIDSAGELSPGVSLSYSISTDDSDETVLCPVAAIQYLDDCEIVFVQADQAPENIMDLSAYPDVTVPDGFYPVQVEIGTANATYIRILSGLEQDMTVFTGYQQSDPGNGSETTTNGETTTTNTQGQMPGGMDGAPSGMNGGGGGGMPGG